MRFVLSAVLALSFVGAAPAQSKELQALQTAVRKVIDDAEPSVACVLVSRSERYKDFNAPISSQPGRLGSFDPPAHLRNGREGSPQRELLKRLDLANPETVPESYGSGVVIDAGGLVLTHFHVVQNATKVYVRLPGKRGSYADVFAADGRSDLAVLKMLRPPEGLKPPRFGDGDKVRKGDFVVGLANPFAAGFRDGGATATHGIVGNLRRKAPNGSESDRLRTLHHLGTLMQTDLRLNLGCSGGAVLNLDGELVGLTTSTAAVVGGETPGGFAVPLSAPLRRIIDVLKRGEEVEYGFLGVGVINPEAELHGARIDQVSPGTPASRAGLQVGETITAIDDVPVNDYDDLFLQVGAALAGTEINLTVKTFGGRPRKVPVKLAKFNYPGASIAANRPPAVFGLRVDYNSVVNSDVPVPDGVFIRDVERGSAAERKYKELLERSRWVIQSVNGKAVTTPAEFYKEVEKVRGPLELKVVEVAKNPESTAKTLTFP